MKRASQLVELSRRDVCGFACAGLALAACSNGAGAIQTGALGAGDDDGTTPDAPDGNPDPDASIGPPVDGHVGTGDAAVQGVACTTTATDVGTASTYVLGKPILKSTFFVVRDSGGLYAVSAKCTHEGAIMAVYNATEYRCPRHGAIFDYDGTIVSGPVSTALVHYAMCNLANGNVGVETTVTVAKTQRLAD